MPGGNYGITQRLHASASPGIFGTQRGMDLKTSARTGPLMTKDVSILWTGYGRFSKRSLKVWDKIRIRKIVKTLSSASSSAMGNWLRIRRPMKRS